MEYDIRQGDFTFKYAVEQNPDPNYYSLEHFHTTYELMYILKGNADLIIQHRAYRLIPHQLFVIKPGEFHRLQIHEGSTYERVILRFSEQDIPEKLEKKLKKVNNIYFIAGTTLSDEILRLEKLKEIFSKDAVPDVFILQLQIILTLLSETYSGKSEYDVNQELKKVLKYIEENLTAIQSVDDVTVHVNMSRSKVQKLISDQLHTGLMEYVRTKKCILATELMKQGVPATSIYQDCGFLDYTTFYRAFRKTFNVSPGEREKALHKKLGVTKKKGLV